MVSNLKKDPDPKFNATRGLKPLYNSRGKQSSMTPHKLRPDSLFEAAYTPRNPRQNRRGTLRFLPQLEMRPSSIVATLEESPEAPHS